MRGVIDRHSISICIVLSILSANFVEGFGSRSDSSSSYSMPSGAFVGTNHKIQYPCPGRWIKSDMVSAECTNPSGCGVRSMKIRCG